MFFYFVIAIAVGSFILSSLLKSFKSLKRNIAIVKTTGIPYRIASIDGIAGFFWTGIHDVILNTLRRLPYSRGWLWPILIEPHRNWHYAQELRDALGEVFIIVSPGQIYLDSCNAEVIAQVSTHRENFVKPVEIYGIIDMFGKNLLTTEGDTWKRHRKVVGPAFSERSNSLVWKESLRQGVGMLKFWAGRAENSAHSMEVGDTATDSALLTFNVISAAGFGIRQLWEEDDEDQLGNKVVPGFNTSKLKPNHKLAFKDAVNTLTGSIIWFAIFPVWLLEKSPFQVHKTLIQSFHECSDYFRELYAYKLQQIEQDEKAEAGTMDLMGKCYTSESWHIRKLTSAGPLVKASENIENSKGLYLTKQEVMANAFILIFAGHETSGGTTHHSFLWLAIKLSVQAQLQADIDAVVDSDVWSTWTYESDLGRLSQSMVGAVINETLRLLPPIIDIPKIVREKPQTLMWDGKTVTVPARTIIHLSAAAVHRNPRYYPHSPSTVSKKEHDLDDWVPERWFSSLKQAGKSDAPEIASVENAPKKLFVPIKGSYIPFSEGARSCPGKRFAQIEITAVLSVIFKTHSVELDVSAWASDEEIETMDKDERRVVYEKAIEMARRMIFESETIVVLQMQEKCALRFVKRGGERFRNCYV
ncbi:Cytochrome P450 [Lachnellula subtilissima]|uniref:Cytochrome P450 n=1 Tax=Lachnellula subtilissima TaxID=602034 RepID=A0A8H8RMP4_9HELO|nr:Cytochrome P450 [Lachnellula subtilissima]